MAKEDWQKEFPSATEDPWRESEVQRRKRKKKRIGRKRTILRLLRGRLEPPLSSIHDFELVEGPEVIPWPEMDSLEGIEPLYLETRTPEGSIGHIQLELDVELFFYYLAENPDCLAFEIFREYIREWQNILQSECYTPEERKRAKEHLRRIGSTLAKTGSGRPAERRGFVMYVEFINLQNRLQPIMREIGNMYPANRVLSFKERCPDLEEYSGCVKRQKTARSVAKAIIAAKYKVGKRTLEEAIREHDEMRGRTPAVRLKKKEKKRKLP